jgi:hypothetical protein
MLDDRQTACTLFGLGGEFDPLIQGRRPVKVLPCKP